MSPLATPWDGVPLNPEVDGWHWIDGEPTWWHAADRRWRVETREGVMVMQPLGSVAHLPYGGPVRTDADLGAAWVQARDAGVSRIKHRAGVLRYFSPAVAIELDAVALIVASTVPPPDLGAALAQILEARAAYLVERLTALCEILESDGEVVGCVGSDAPAEHEVGLARALIRARTPTTEERADG